MNKENQDNKDAEPRQLSERKTPKNKIVRKPKPKPRPSEKESQKERWTFPRHSLEQAIKLAQLIEDKNAGNPIDALELANYAGFNQAEDWRFKHLLISAKQYGLIEGTGAKAKVSLAQIGQNIVSPSSAEERQRALIQAVSNVEAFKKVLEFYGDKRVPEDEFFSNKLTKEFDIPRDRVQVFIDVFHKNRAFVKAFGFDKPEEPNGQFGEATSNSKSNVASGRPNQEPSAREYLNNCFVLMPFGGYFDEYYREVYHPAIKDAGFEPVRADDLFRAGMLMEQIWEQIEKADVLLAELTSKNANVFYELGLAHACAKPTVIVTASIDDVPFDLRHLRVIEYDVRKTSWSAKLKADITTYLKSAKADPDKSIPQTFRKLEHSGR